MTQKKLKRKLVFLHIFSFLASVLPLGVVVAMHYKEWFTTPAETVKLGIGVIIAIVFIAIKVLGKLKMPRRIVTFGIVFAMAYLLEALLADLLMLSGAAFLGELADLILFQSAIKRTREQIGAEKCADATSAQIKTILEEYVGSGRT